MKNDEYIGWVTATCKNKECQKAFMYFDKNGKFNDLPPDCFYCPECIAKGFKNKREKKLSEPEKFLKEKNIKDNIIKKQFLKLCKMRNHKRYTSLLKEAIEIAGYIKEEKE